MNAYDYAMQLEKDGESYYREGAARSASRGLSRILTMLADQEAVHYNIFRDMKEHKAASLPATTLLDDVKNIFVTMKQEGAVEGIAASEIDLYRTAQDIEKKTEDFYREQAGKAGDSGERESFLQVAREENRHFFVLQQIIDFVSGPSDWLENAEWYHQEEY
jgi:rubrerythrin